MGEHDTSPIDLVTRRYATVAIIKPYDACPQVCVYCQRNWEITGPLAPGAMASRKKLNEAIDWFAEHPEIFDILITGGDPFTMSDEKIEYILERFSSMEHVVQIRWGTRTRDTSVHPQMIMSAPSSTRWAATSAIISLPSRIRPAFMLSY